MNSKRKVFDIRTSELAMATLCTMTGVSSSTWQECIDRGKKYYCTDNFIEAVVNENGYLPSTYTDWAFTILHLTTSANNCSSFWKYGIQDLQQVYMRSDSELRVFLENHGIDINLEKHRLSLSDRTYDIKYYIELFNDNEKKLCNQIGHKLYDDFAICGFYSITDEKCYGGYVHRRPEILRNIDALLGFQLSQEWYSTHTAFGVIAKVRGDQILYQGVSNQDEKRKVLYYLSMAFCNAFNRQSENIAIIQNNYQIPAENIIEIKPFTSWDHCHY